MIPINRKKILLPLIALFLPFVSIYGKNDWSLETNWPASPAGAELTPEATIAELVVYLYEWGIILGVLLTFGILIYASFKYILSSGDYSKLSDAKSKITSSFMGLFLLLGSWMLISVLNPELSIISQVTVPTIQYSDDTDAERIYKEEDLCDYGVIDFKLRGDGDIKRMIMDHGDVEDIQIEPLSSIACKAKTGFGDDVSAGEIRFVKARTVSKFGTWEMTGSDLRNPICDIDCAEDPDEDCAEEIFIEVNGEEEINYKYCYDHRELALGFTGSVKYISQKPQSLGTTCLAGDEMMEDGGGCSFNLYETTLTGRCGGRISATSPSGTDISSTYDKKVNCVEIIRHFIPIRE